VLPHCRDVMFEEDRVENQHEEGCRSMWEMLLGPFRDTVRARSFVDLEIPDGFLNLLRVG